VPERPCADLGLKLGDRYTPISEQLPSKLTLALLVFKGGPEPSILDDFCLGNVISKYFSKLSFGTS